MTCRPALMTVIFVSLTWLAGCTSTPDRCDCAPPPPVERPPLPAQVVDSPVPDFPAWMDRILSSSMARLGLSLPSSPPPPETRAKP